MVQAWRAHLETISAEVHEVLAAIPPEVLGRFAGNFYAAFLEDPRAQRFLTHEQVQRQLKPSLQRWLRTLLGATVADAEALATLNQQAGVIHARLDIPLDLVVRGFRILRLDLHRHLASACDRVALAYETFGMASESMDIAQEGMSLAYSAGHVRAVRSDVAYRLFSLMHNVSTERERQRALLLDWENRLLYALAEGGDGSAVGTLADSDFGLWFAHKGVSVFGDDAEAARIRALIVRVDDLMAVLSADAPAARSGTLQEIREQVEAIRRTLAMLFDRAIELEAGSDPLTALLNRRFVAPVLRHEIELAEQKGSPFSVLAADIDHFKEVNDRYGHDAGDAVLRHIAGLLTQCTRGSDYVFRLGGEEFAIVLVNCGGPSAVLVAEELRRRVAATPVPWQRGAGMVELRVTVSIGVVTYDRHPDYRYLLTRADAAMYRAKRDGRNRVCVADALAGTDTFPDDPGVDEMPGGTADAAD